MSRLRGRRRRQSQDVDVDASFTLEDEGQARGYYIGVVGSLLKYTMTMLGSIMILAAQLDPSALFFAVIMIMFFLLGWIMSREAGLVSLQTYDTVLDVLAYGSVLGFLIRIIEGVVFTLTTGILTMDYLSPFTVFLNSPTIGNGYLYMVVGLAFAAVAEELLHRGGMIYLISILTDRYGMTDGSATGLALFMQAGTFSLLHAAVYQKPEQFAALFAGGLMFGLIFIWKKDLSVCMIAHLVINLSALSPFVFDYLIRNPLALFMVILTIGVLLYCMTRGGGKPK
ncbi:MAG: CPBP family glutamic-type intramembrane protease [Candidatus Thorarchaeota archaeon]|jgi:membrane protease YdiL (CAAX protease family)